MRKTSNRISISCLLLVCAALFSCSKDSDDASAEMQKSDQHYALLKDFCDSINHPLPKSVSPGSWMSWVDDDRMLCKMSIPGTHSSMTGMDFYDSVFKNAFNLLQTTQIATLSKQLSCGIRYVDIRPVVSTDAENHRRVLRCCSGISEIAVTFKEALDTIRDFVDSHPSEFVIVRLQADNGTEDQSAWPEMMKAELNGYDALHPGLFASWHPDITVGELRGKILFINRSSFAGMKGAFGTWNNEDPDINETLNRTEECSYTITDVSQTVSAPLFVQDYCKTNSSVRLLTKTTAVTEMLATARECAADDANRTLVINHCSAYTKAGAKGHADNAQAIHPYVIDDILDHPGETVGIIVMDFSCYDNVSCIMNAGNPYLSSYIYDFKPMSQSLTNILILSNLK